MRIQLVGMGVSKDKRAFRKLKQDQIDALQKYIGKHSSFKEAAKELGMPEHVLQDTALYRKVGKEAWTILNKKVFNVAQ